MKKRLKLLPLLTVWLIFTISCKKLEPSPNSNAVDCISDGTVALVD